MITIHTFSTSNVTVSVIHNLRPLLSASVLTGTDGTGGLLYGNIETVYLYMTFLVIPGLFLRLGRVSVNL